MFWNKKNEPEKKIPLPPSAPVGVNMPPKTKEQPSNDIIERLDKIEKLIIEHHNIMFGTFSKGVIVLNDDELRYIPEDKKEEYMDVKKNNPEIAQLMLDGYKARTQK